jgi:hypothetical protein
VACELLVSHCKIHRPQKAMVCATSAENTMFPRDLAAIAGKGLIERLRTSCSETDLL